MTPEEGQPIRRYAVHDPDPSYPLAVALGVRSPDELCREPIDPDWHPGWETAVEQLGLEEARARFQLTCTWPRDHSHPQHLAGASNGEVVGVRDV